MKRFKEFINEGNAMDFLKPKSDEDIKAELNKLDAINQTIKIVMLELDKKFMPSKEEIKKAYAERYQSQESKWAKGNLNTKSFKVDDGYWNEWIPKCRNCDEVTELENCFDDRQMVGNAYKSLCNCSKCGLYVVLDEDQYNSLVKYLKDH